MSKVFIEMFINTAFVVLVVYSDYSSIDYLKYLPFLSYLNNLSKIWMISTTASPFFELNEA